MDSNRENNCISVGGWVQEAPTFSHSLYGEAFYTFPLVVPRLSGVEDVLPVMAGERLLESLPCVGQHLSVTGQLRSYNMQMDGRNRLLILVFARGIEEKSEEAFCNDVLLTGFVCKPPVYRMTPFSREIADLLIAVNRPYHKSDYLPVIVWGRNARFASGLAVGDKITVIGRMQSRTYQKNMPDGTAESRIAYEMSAAIIERAEN